MILSADTSLMDYLIGDGVELAGPLCPKSWLGPCPPPRQGRGPDLGRVVQRYVVRVSGDAEKNKSLKLNLDDLALYLAVEGGPVPGDSNYHRVRHALRPAGHQRHRVLHPVPYRGRLHRLVAGISHVGVSFDRPCARSDPEAGPGPDPGLCAFESAFALALGGMLAVVERFLCVPLWRSWRDERLGNGRVRVMEFAVFLRPRRPYYRESL